MCCESIAHFRLAEARIVQLKFCLVKNFAAKSWEVVLSEKVYRFAPGFGENQRVPIFAHRMLDELAGNG
jgi:hypothetical protein